MRALLPGGGESVVLHTEAGHIRGRHHPAPAGNAAMLWLPGAAGGLGGPADQIFARIAATLTRDRIASLEIDWRRPAAPRDCLLDALFALAWLHTAGRRRIAIAGHAFGGAVAIAAGAAAPRAVVGVAALASQARGTEDVGQLAPRPLLLAHGLADEIVPPECSRDIHRRAGGPKRLILYPSCGHDFEGCRAALRRDLVGWVEQVLGGAPPAA